MSLYERYQAAEAKKAFFDGLARFQQVCPEIEKRGRVDYTHNGRRTAFNHALLSDIVREIKPALLAGGLTYRWEQKEADGVLSVTCIITHIDGHSERTSMSAKADTSGSKNEIQARGSTVTYLQRYTLIGGLGIGTAEQDVDGGPPETGVPADVADWVKKATTLDDLRIVWDGLDNEQKTRPALITLFSNRRAEISKPIKP